MPAYDPDPFAARRRRLLRGRGGALPDYSQVPAGALTLGGVPLTLNGNFLKLGA